MPKSEIKNNLIYRVYSCEQDYTDKGGPFWYVGVEGNGIVTHKRIRPSIFRLIQYSEKIMTLESAKDITTIVAN